MSAGHSREIERALFDASAQIEDAAARLAFLDRACAGEPALRARLDALLAAHGAADSILDRPAAALVPPPMDAGFSRPGLAETRTHIGPYRLLERIGEGGCGVVYLAEQQEPVRRRVALKIIRLGMDTERAIARFELERQALASMNHPHVARVLDAGATASGRPFFVMELVEGEPITAYCDHRRLDIRARLALFVQVCHAIQHAHQKGILHRDIKPSNILVADDPQSGPVPKVIDFGVATHADRPSGAATFIDGEQFLGTPAYTSPEQAAPGRADVDTRSDIYSLGALLYELLTGRPPFDSRRLLEAGMEDLRRTLREVEPPRPSRLLRSLPAGELARVAALRREVPAAYLDSLRRELDWIVLRAMEKDPARRYATANGLALDVVRHLNDEPVEARPPGRAYRFRKLVRRNRVLFAGIVAVSLALLAGLGTSSVLFLRERRALHEQTRLRGEAEIAATLTRAVFLTREGNFALADQVLAGLPLPISQASFDGVVAFRAVGDWLAAQRRWDEAADRFRVAIEIGQLDTWGPVAQDYQSYCLALLLAGRVEDYARFRERTVERFSPSTSTDAVARILQTCLLRPIDPSLRERLLPFGARTEFWLSGLNPRLASGWALLPVSLWRYRLGEFPEAAGHARRGIESSGGGSARVATLRLILALCEARAGRSAEARQLLDVARRDIQTGFLGDLSRGDSVNGYWYDWAFAHHLLAEAEAVVEG